MGIEKYVDHAVMAERPDLENAYCWRNGMELVHPSAGQRQVAAVQIMEILDKSGQFGPTRFNDETGTIEFGTHPMYFKGDEEAWTTYIERFRQFEEGRRA